MCEWVHHYTQHGREQFGRYRSGLSHLVSISSSYLSIPRSISPLPFPAFQSSAALSTKISPHHLSYVSTLPENALTSLRCYYSFDIFLLLRFGPVFQRNGEHSCLRGPRTGFWGVLSKKLFSLHIYTQSNFEGFATVYPLSLFLPSSPLLPFRQCPIIFQLSLS